MLHSLGRLARQRGGATATRLRWLLQACAEAEPGCCCSTSTSTCSSCPSCCSSSSSSSSSDAYAPPSTRRALSSSSVGGSGSAEVERKKMVNKLLYRARQRGFLELDLLVGLWAEQEVPRMDAATLRQFAEVLDQENPDLFKWLTGQQPAPQQLAGNAAFTALSAHVARQLADHAPQAAQAAAGKEWVRGWDDGWKQGQHQGQQQPAAAAGGGGSGGGGSA